MTYERQDGPCHSDGSYCGSPWTLGRRRVACISSVCRTVLFRPGNNIRKRCTSVGSRIQLEAISVGVKVSFCYGPWRTQTTPIPRGGVVIWDHSHGRLRQLMLFRPAGVDPLSTQRHTPVAPSLFRCRCSDLQWRAGRHIKCSPAGPTAHQPHLRSPIGLAPQTILPPAAHTVSYRVGSLRQSQGMHAS